MEPAGIILQEFYAAIVSRDMAKARTYLADDMVYEGIFKELPNADAYMAVFESFMEFTTRLDVKMIFADGENAAVFYEMETTKPARAVTFVGEWHQVRNGKIVRARAACDGTSLRRALPIAKLVSAIGRIVSLKDWFQRLLKPAVPAGRIYEIPPLQDSPASVPPGWTGDSSVVLPDGRTPEELVDYVFVANESSRANQALINELCAEFRWSTRRCDRGKDPIAWLSFQRAFKSAPRPPSG